MNAIHMKLRGRPYDLIGCGVKTVECRLYDEKRRAIRAGDLLIFHKQPYLHEVMYRRVGAVERFSSWADMFTSFGGGALGCRPDENADDFARAMSEYYSAEDAEALGVCAITLLPYEGGYEIPVTGARRINERDIEIHFADDFETGSEPAYTDYKAECGGVPLRLDENYGRHGRVHFAKTATVRLRNPLPVGDGAPVVKIGVFGREYDAPYDDFYKYYVKSAAGITVKGSGALLLGEATVRRAAEIVDIMLGSSPDIAEQMVKSGASLSIYGKGECAFHIPEHRGGYRVESLYVEGFGGVACSITECNVWHWRADRNPPDPDYTTRYIDESILVHEFGHGVKIAGIDRMADRSLHDEFLMLYRHARAAGLWPDTYAISNPDEYFATLSAIWFNVMNECRRDDGWDGVRGPVNTRRELYNYDVDAYRFFAKIYPRRDLDGEWTPVPDRVHVTGLRDDPDVDLSHDPRTFSYPLPTHRDGEIVLGERYAILSPRGGFAAAVDEDHAALAAADGDIPDSASFIFESAEGGYRIKSVLGGYMRRDGDRLLFGGEGSVFAVEYEGDGIFTVRCGGERLVLAGRRGVGTPLSLTGDAERHGGRWRLAPISELKLHALFIHGGAANGSERGVFAASGEAVALTAADCGRRFLRWRAARGDIADTASPTTTIIMPDSDDVVYADYE